MHYCDQFHGIISQQTRKGLHVQRAVIENGNIQHLYPRLRCKQLPRDNIGVMLHLSRQHNIASAKIGSSPPLRKKIKALGGSSRENPLAPAAFVYEAPDFLARFFICSRRLFTELVDAPVNISMI